MRRLRESHGAITGTGFDGAPYRASEPEAWAWVHLSNADTMLTFQHLLGAPLGPGEEERYWADWRQAGLLLGISAERLPADVGALRAHVDEMATTTLGDNETVRALLETLSLHDVPPPHLFPTALWAALRPVGRDLLLETTVGTLPPALRSELGLAWSVDQQRRLERTAALVRAASVAVPDRALHYPMAYRAMRAARRLDDRGRRPRRGRPAPAAAAVADGAGRRAT